MPPDGSKVEWSWRGLSGLDSDLVEPTSRTSAPSQLGYPAATRDPFGARAKALSVRMWLAPDVIRSKRSGTNSPIPDISE